MNNFLTDLTSSVICLLYSEVLFVWKSDPWNRNKKEKNDLLQIRPHFLLELFYPKIYPVLIKPSGSSDLLLSVLPWELP